MLVTKKWAVSTTAILVTVFLMASLAQFGAVEANPGFPPGIFDEPTIYIASPSLGKIYQETSIPIEIDVLP